MFYVVENRVFVYKDAGNTLWNSIRVVKIDHLQQNEKIRVNKVILYLISKNTVLHNQIKEGVFLKRMWKINLCQNTEN